MLGIAELGAAKLIDGIPVWQTSKSVSDGTSDIESFGEIDAFQSLGITATPYPRDESGYAECVVAENIGGRSGVCIGGRDTRNAGFLGKQSPGDVTLHSTGPSAVAQCFLKNKKRQAGLATENSKNETMVFVLDGKNDKAQLVANGAIVEVDKKGDISLVNSSGAGIRIEGGKIVFLGEVSLPGMTAGFVLAQMLPAGQAVGPAAVLLTPVMGVGK